MATICGDIKIIGEIRLLDVGEPMPSVRELVEYIETVRPPPFGLLEAKKQLIQTIHIG